MNIDSDSVLQKLVNDIYDLRAKEYQSSSEWALMSGLDASETAHFFADSFKNNCVAKLRSALEPTLAERAKISDENLQMLATASEKLEETLQRAEAAEQALREARAIQRAEKEILIREIAENDKLRSILRRSWETINDFFQDKTGEAELNKMGDEVRQALSPSPTPAHDTNTQSLCRAKPSPDSATPAGQLIVNMSTGEVLLARSDHSDETITSSDAATTGRNEN